MKDREIKVTHLERVPALPYEPAPGAPAPETVVSPWRKIHQNLRGRYFWALLLALLGAGGGAYLGLTSQEPLYRGYALIYIKPSMPSLEDPMGANVLPQFQAFIGFQVSLLHSQRASLLAMDTEVWRKTGQPSGPDAIADFEERRKIIHTRGSHHLQVQFLDPEAEVALAGVRALTKAYQKLSEDLNSANESLEFARTRTEVLSSQIKTNSDQILTFTAEYGGVEGMEIRHRATMKQVLHTEELVGDVRGRIRNFVSTEDAEKKTAIPPREIAVENQLMASSLYELDRLQAEEEYQAEKYGEKNEGLIQLRRQIKIREMGIERMAEAWNRQRATKQAGGATLEELKTREQGILAYLQVLEGKNRKISRTRSEVERLKASSEDLSRQLKQATTLRDQLAAQLVGKGRVTIADPGTEPTTYYRDRRITNAVMGGGLGAALGILLILLIGVRDRTLKDTGDIDHSLSRVRLLGLIPSVSLDRDDDERQYVAAHCVHQIRTFLQIGLARQGGACICVTGPGVDSGKTTLTTALGLSFASSGTRTLLIDADLTGRSLTWRVSQMLLERARRVATGVDPHADGDDPVRNAERNSRFLLERLTADEDAGWPEASELKDLLAQSIERLGLREAKASGVIDDLFALADLLFPGDVRDDLSSDLMVTLAAEGVLTFGTPAEWIPARVVELDAKNSEFNGSPIENFLYRSGVDSLRFLPLRGLGRGGDVSVSTIAKILDRVRGEFDVALVDTGPVPGTVEASMVAAHADSAVLVVSPGDHRPDAEKAVAHMEDVGANLAGIVFNRAGRSEVLRTSMSRSAPSRGAYRV